MQPREKEHAEGKTRAKNIGGIQETSVEFSPGVTILVGRNATNRTSFLQAVMAALGSENVSIKGDADEAEVELTIGDETYTRKLSRRSSTIVTSGNPYLDDPELADLFAFLLESNEARRAVATNADLRELIMRPVDTGDIQSDIDRLVEERKSLEQKLDEIDGLKGELTGLEEKRTQLQDQIEATEEELAATEEELAAADTDIEETHEERSELENKLEELRSKRSRVDDVHYDLETEQESLEALKQERRELEDEYGGLPEVPVGKTSGLESEIDRLRKQKQQLEAGVNELQNVISFNEEMLSDAGAFEDRVPSDDDGVVTDQLLADGEVLCWTCGSEVEQDQIEATLSRLRDLSQSKVSEVSDLERQIDDLRSEKREFERAQRERDRIERRLDTLETDIEQTEERIEDLHDRRDELTAEIETIEEDVEELEDEEYSTVLDFHKKANQLEYELGQLENDRERVESNIAELEDRIAKEGDVKAQLEEVNAELEDLRTRIERVEENAIEQFNDHMDTVLELLDYENLDRIWIEKLEREVPEGRRKVSESVFELHVVRTSDSGAAYEDTVEHLSESEREVTGLVFALAGYLAHKVYEDVPFMLLDSLEAIDSERIATLIGYLTEYTGYFLVALLPEDAAALSDDYERITEI